MVHDKGGPLAQRTCEACRPDSPAVAAAQHGELLGQLPGWQITVVDGIARLTKTYTLANFVAALDLANRIGALAESEDHHPQLVVEWGSLSVSWWTHTIGGLHMNDFILAARCEDLAG